MSTRRFCVIFMSKVVRSNPGYERLRYCNPEASFRINCIVFFHPELLK